MTANRRISLNIIATYGISLYALVLGLLAARWALQVLGHVGYGLYGVVGGLTVLIPFLLLHPIIPVYNVAPYLRECLDSVLVQKGLR